MTEPPPGPTERINRLNLNSPLRENIEETIGNQLRSSLVRNQHGHSHDHRIQHGHGAHRDEPQFFPGVGYLSALLAPTTASSAFHDAQLALVQRHRDKIQRAIRADRIRNNLHDVDTLDTTWSEFVFRLEEFNEDTALERLNPRHSAGCLCLVCDKALAAAQSEESIYNEGASQIFEKQVISSELQSFINNLQQDHKACDKYDAGESIKLDNSINSRQVMLWITLIFLGIFITMNISSALYLFHKHLTRR